VKQLYNKDYISDDECTTNKKKKINIDNKFYKKKDENKNSINININNKKINFKQKYTYIDDSSIKNKKFKDHRNLPDLSIYFFIQMEFCQQMTLAQYIEDHSNTKINNKVIYTFTYQLIKSLAKIHSKNIIHANINPENIFVINEDSIKIGDFSSAKDIEPKLKKKSK
jgi:serine/threonine protein kinase